MPALTLSDLEARHAAARDARDRADLRALARRIAKRSGAEVPAWAITNGRRGRPVHVHRIEELHALQALHDVEPLPSRFAQCRLRLKARRLAAKLGVPPPEWARDAERVQRKAIARTLAALRECHDDPGTPTRERETLRFCARVIATRLSLSVPAWAAGLATATPNAFTAREQRALEAGARGGSYETISRVLGCDQEIARAWFDDPVPGTFA